ncbi:hypothetical protein DO021_00240 [Desulfobacter hydrogenophilus]|uniref:Integrase SAM-like N-terminal domain-containing protein n=1 Tax=Desulfobacter hydrogenophilus TaxID=2291 RepID=A0A328FK82_9BACT|nr:hypothetical protein [Desulfobacter hydrogenophilus]NDY72280.1 hypothetical protein [Desulfobacter hydrogenophilus]QBH12907.1 hypothetical protein EYB58_08255 [Desulfobacter hydrogenophilus]RAM03892.1 hypothetical protein DO021_00240 [Desulfobacter hydrogenophilus]
MINSETQPKEYPAYRKWLRHYLDFCKKYDHGYADIKSLPLFVDKLKSKNQDSFQQDQTQKAPDIILCRAGRTNTITNV